MYEPMDLFDYQRKATETFKPGEPLEKHDARLCDWALGIASESGELAGLIKHRVFHKQKVGTMEIAKEVGDVLWYLSALCETLHINLEDCATLNLAKLAHRHKGSFSFDRSENRRRLEGKFEDTKEYEEIRRRILNES